MRASCKVQVVSPPSLAQCCTSSYLVVQSTNTLHFSPALGLIMCAAETSLVAVRETCKKSARSIRCDTSVRYRLCSSFLVFDFKRQKSASSHKNIKNMFLKSNNLLLQHEQVKDYFTFLCHEAQMLEGSKHRKLDINTLENTSGISVFLLNIKFKKSKYCKFFCP